MTDPERTDLIFPPDSDTPPSTTPVPLGSSETAASLSTSSEVGSGAASTRTSLQTQTSQLPGSEMLASGTNQTAAVDTSLNSTRTLVGSLELRMEVPRVEVRREASGQATVRRERRVREETVVVELVSEVLIIETRPGSAAGGAGVVLLDGVELPAGETRELVIYREEATVSKQTVLSEEVRVYKQSSSVRQDFPTELAHEELVVEHRATQESLIQGASLQQVPNMGGSDESR